MCNTFKDLNIEPSSKTFVGDKIYIHDILGTEIFVHDYSVTKSNYTEKGDGHRLNLQLKVNNADKVMFTGSLVLRDMITKVPKDKLPIKTTIIKKNRRFEFT